MEGVFQLCDSGSEILDGRLFFQTICTLGATDLRATVLVLYQQ